MRLEASVKQALRAARHPGLAVQRWKAQSPSTRDPRLIAYLMRTRGVRGTLGQRHLDDRFFEKHVALERGYAELARILFSWAHPGSVCDLGCGNAYILAWLAARSVRVQGVDSSQSILHFVDPAIRDRILIRDLSRRQTLGQFDLVICTEVAEHLPKRSSRVLVGNVARHAGTHVFFSAAQPGQWGVGHINCQPREYWISLFVEHGLLYDTSATRTLSGQATLSPEIMQSLPWLVGNIMAFSRHETHRALPSDLA
jgi:SAM-dependent methyltransferase